MPSGSIGWGKGSVSDAGGRWYLLGTWLADPSVVENGESTIFDAGFETFPVGSVGSGVGDVGDTTDGRWRPIGASAPDPSVVDTQAHTGLHSMQLSRGSGVGANFVGWTTGDAVPNNIQFDVSVWVNVYDDEGSWTMAVNNYDYIQINQPIAVYITNAQDIRAWEYRDDGGKGWYYSGAMAAVGSWTGIKIVVTDLGDGGSTVAGRGFYDVYTNNGSGWARVMQDIGFDSSKLYDGVNCVFFSPQGATGISGYIDDVAIVSHASKSLEISCGYDGQNIGGWTLAAGVPKGTPYDFVSFVNPIGNGSWQAYVNNYNYVQYDGTSSAVITERPVGWYIDSSSNLLVWDTDVDGWRDTGADCPAGQWTGIKLIVTDWDDGEGRGSYDVYTDSGMGFTEVLSGVKFNSSDMKDDVNSVFIKPVGPAGSAVGYMDNISISTLVSPAGCEGLWNVFNQDGGLWADVNHDCYVDFRDISVMADNWLGAKAKALSIDWREGPAYPLGIQDAAVCLVNGKIISAGGFSRYPDPEPIMDSGNTPHWPDAFGGESSGFTKLTLMFDPDDEAGGWSRITDIPGPLRQGMGTTVVSGSEMIVIGGFNYSDTFSYRYCYRLRYVDDSWTWSFLNYFPWNVTHIGCATVGRKVYAVGGADFFEYPGSDTADFHTEKGRVKTSYPDGTPVGNALLMLDLDNTSAGWQRLADMPGTPRSCQGGVVAMNDKIYVLGGMFAPAAVTATYHNVTDNWVYDIATNTWTRLTDMPTDIANMKGFAYANRYIIMTGGFKYKYTRYPDGSSACVMNDDEQQQWAEDWRYFFQDRVFVYDTVTDEFTDSDTLLDRSSSMLGVLVNGDAIYSTGGEASRRLWHPSILQIGIINEVNNQ